MEKLFLNNLKFKIRLFLFGIIFTIIILETGLRIFGFFYKQTRETTTNKQIEKADFKIMAFGNSFTYGIGAPPGKSYPDFLQKEFDDKFKNKKVIVVNKGMGGANSAMMLRKINEYIDEVNPDLVILRSGERNFDEKFLMNDYYKRERIRQSFLTKVLDYSNNILYYSKLYKLLFNFAKEIIKKINNADHETNKDFFSFDGPDYNYYLFLERKMKKFYENKFSENELEEIITWLKKDRIKNPHNHHYYCLGKAYILSKNYKLAALEFIDGIKKYPNTKSNPNYLALANLANEINDFKLKQEILKFIQYWSTKYPAFKYEFVINSKQSIIEWIKSDITEMIKILKNKKIKIVMHNYPFSISSPERDKLNLVLKEIANDYDIPFLDFEKKIILEKLKYDNYQQFVKDYYAMDAIEPTYGHLNSKGYQLNAKHLFELIIEKIFKKHFKKFEAEITRQ